MYEKLTLVFSHTTTTSSNLIVKIAKMSGDSAATTPHGRLSYPTRCADRRHRALRSWPLSHALARRWPFSQALAPRCPNLGGSRCIVLNTSLTVRCAATTSSYAMTPRLLAVNAFIKLTLRCHVKAFIKYSGMICIGKLKKTNYWCNIGFFTYLPLKGFNFLFHVFSYFVMIY
jgi:hypothetical protein